MKNSKTKFLIILAIAVMLVWGSSYLFLPDTGAQKSSDQTTISLGAYHRTTAAAKPDKIEGYKTPRYSTEGVKKQEGGETCETATVIGSLPFNATGYTCDNVHDYDEVCPYGPHTSPDVVYSYAPGADETVNIDLWGSSYDTKLFVYEDECVSPYYACNDDYYSNYVSAIMGLDIYAGHTYYIVVDGYGGDCGDYIILVETVEPCDVVCPGEGIPEGEPVCYDYYDDMYNGGCNSTPYVFQDINCGDIICGTSGTFISALGNTRDTDWFRVTLTDPATLTWKVVAEFPLLIFVIEESDCAAPNILGSATANMCDTASLTFDVPAGVYWLWVGPSVFEGVPCGKEYVGEITCEVAETGACCYDLDPYTCTITTPEGCTDPDYTFLGLGTDCGPPNPCLPGPPNDDCEDAIELYPPDCPDWQTVTGTTVGATIDCPGILDWQAVWYKFTLTYASNNLYVDYCCTQEPDLNWRGIVFYPLCPTNDDECGQYIFGTDYYWQTCPDGHTDLFIHWDNLPPGEYYLPVISADVDWNPLSFCFDICVEAGAGPPPNDDCVNAEPVGDVTDLAFCTDAATNDGDGTCMSSPNIWYCYTATCTGDATVSLCGSDYDTKLAVYDGCICDPLGTEIECNDDYCGVQSQITFLAEQGHEYLIEVGGYSSNTGDGILNISCVGLDQGACCNDLEPYDCQVLTEAECIALPDHTFMGIGTDCDPNPCLPGNTCDLPIEVELPLDLPYMDRDQFTCGRGDNYDNTCLGYYDGGEDIIYELTVTEDVYVMITFDPKGTTWNGIALDGACPLDPSTCLYVFTQSGSSPHSFEYNLGVGTYYIQIDTWPSPDCIPDFDLTIDPLGPEIEVSPASFDVVLNPDPPNNTADETMNITNNGYEDLNYEITEDPEVAWLSFAPGSGTVLPGMTDPVTVSFDASGLAAGDYYTTLVVASNSLKQLEDTVLVPVHLAVELAPDISVEPGAMEMGVLPGCEMYRSVQVQNAGPGELRFEVSVGETPPSGKLADVLLVDDDNSAVFGEPDFTDVVGYFTAALDANGYTYDIVEITVEGGDGPDAATMADYPVVIWFCGEAWANNQTLTPTDEANLATYLDGGGNLFLTAHDYLWDRYPSAGSFSPGQFPYDYLGVTYTTQDLWVIVDPASGTAVGMPGSVAEGMAFDLFDPYTLKAGGNGKGPDDGLYIDEITHNGVDLFQMTSPPPTGIAACQYETAKGFKTVFTTVDFAGLVDGVSPSTRAEFMGNIMNWFLKAACPFTVAPEMGTIPPDSFFDVVLTFDGTAFEQCSEDVLTCYLVISSNDPIDPVVSVPVDMWSGRGDVMDPWCLIQLGDVVFLINFVYRDGPAPDPACMGDCNHDGIDGDVQDVVYLIKYLYLQHEEGYVPPPMATPEIGQPLTPLERK